MTSTPLPPATYGPGRVVAAHASDGTNKRCVGCEECRCQCHDEDPYPPGVYITVALDSTRGVYICRRVVVTEEPAPATGPRDGQEPLIEETA